MIMAANDNDFIPVRDGSYASHPQHSKFNCFKCIPKKLTWLTGNDLISVCFKEN